jgi:GTP-binding protein HflX
LHLHGNISGLKPNHIKKLFKLYQRKIPTDEIISIELSKEICSIASELHRQIGVLADRKGHISHVIIGDSSRLVIPCTGENILSSGRLKGLRLLHVHLKGEGLSKEDLTDLRLLSLDAVLALTMKDNMLPDRAHIAHLLPHNPGTKIWEILDPVPYHAINIPFQEFISALESEIAREISSARIKSRIRERAIIVLPWTNAMPDTESVIQELKDLCRTAGVEVASAVIQKISSPDPRYVVGKGKLEEIVLRSYQAGIDLLIFGCNLSPSQVRAIGDYVEVRVIDRTQLILDIFAKRARTRAGKIQVELAQLKYMLPRLREKDTALSRLTGGIGGTGPGETKLEIQRRRVKDKIAILEREIIKISRQREERRKRRNIRNIPIIAIVGYTNAGKSTLLNTLTMSSVFVEDKLFATLDPASRRMRFPENREVIFTDTMGFIRDLPEDLISAFKSTLEEIEDADVILHLVDSSSVEIDRRIQAVNSILSELSLDRIRQIVVFNKTDLITDPEKIEKLRAKYSGMAVSAINPESTIPLIEKLFSIVAMFTKNAGMPRCLQRGGFI